MNHSTSLAIFLSMFVVMPVLLFFGLRWLARRWLSSPPSLPHAAEIKNVERFARLSPATRTYVAVAICLSSAVWGVVAIHRGLGSTSSIAFNVAFAWSIAGSWLAGNFTREHWSRLARPMSSIYQEARQDKLPKAAPLARVMTAGSGLMMLAGIVGWFV